MTFVSIAAIIGAAMLLSFAIRQAARACSIAPLREKMAEAHQRAES